MGHVVGYIRVSSIGQNTERQLDGITTDKTFTDKASGKDTNRPQLQAAIDHCREGDTFIVHSIDRLARSLGDLEKIVETLTAKGVVVKFITQGLTFTNDRADPMATLMMHMLGAVAQFERALIKERQLEGIAIAKEAGKYRGGVAKLTPEKVRELAAEDEAANSKGRSALAKKYGLSRESLYKYLEQAGRITRSKKTAEGAAQ
ncbi:recombinase family protein [Uliginosibacterium sp. 31-12]|uniref:recombinase family protein n=1 Tax=Uliginosibacterium sp. 31-12 TaxID=3062781 RepID=UPI0026E2DEC9|nr:recombinase family protein [Uliginosibacterium sp. 31-12]MDO6385277.1 recombinase family protein [Uliginosibacterium sp. 31-12]